MDDKEKSESRFRYIADIDPITVDTELVSLYLKRFAIAVFVISILHLII